MDVDKVVFDSWYSSEGLMKIFTDQGVDVVCQLKKNRLVQTSDETISLKEFTKKSRLTKNVFIDDVWYRFKVKKVKLKEVEGTLIIVKQKNDKGWSKSFYIFSTEKDFSAEDILRTYKD